MHAGETKITAALAAGLVRERFPQWAGLPLRQVTSAGTVHALFRLGDELVIRLPRVAREGPGQAAVAQLAPYLPVPVPALLGEGRPTAGYPFSWSVVRWLAGETPVEGHLTAPGYLASDLAAFIVALRSASPAGGPRAYPDGPLSTLSGQTRHAIDQLHGQIDTSAVTAIWEKAERLPAWKGPATWVHADLMPGNLLTRNGRLTGVIDFDAAGLGDPSQDLIVAWMLLPAEVRPAFRRATGTDDASWLRGRARALSMALGHLHYYRATNAVMAGNARYTIGEVLADYQRTGE
jgi:aminoglycoside phosphotransferase (APT) family kinase protein